MKLPVAAAVVIVTESEGRYLMIEEDRGSSTGTVWYFPSGALDVGETHVDAARREVLEETGYHVEPSDIIAVDHGAFRKPDGLLWWRFVVSARPISPVPILVHESGIVSVEWCDVEQIESLSLRNRDAVELCKLHESFNGLSLEHCRLREDGTLEGFFA
jgi:8-oxo-dGTP pyrophosphatase MutT (NUDIX family)